MLKLCGFVHLFLLEIVCNFQFKNSIDVGSILPMSRMNGDKINFLILVQKFWGYLTAV
jgi:hypothetical protein